MPIYTKTGDKGETSLYGGKRVWKHEATVNLYGSVDELNSWIGYMVTDLKDDKTVREFFENIQKDLFLIGSTLAGANLDLEVLLARIKKMEDLIDEMEKDLPKLTKFILPGGTRLAARVHVIRAVCRRVERMTVAYAQEHPVPKRVLRYFNRLSDLLFVTARFINNKAQEEEVVWERPAAD